MRRYRSGLIALLTVACPWPFASISSDSVHAEEIAIDRNRESDRLYRAPAMFGDGFFGYSGPIRARQSLDRLLILADDLDAPNPLPAAGSQLTITEAGPIGIYSTTLMSMQHLQLLRRDGQPLPLAFLENVLPDNATLTTAQSIASIQAQLAASAEGYDIIGIIPPPAGYTTGIDALFVVRNGAGGTTVFDVGASGAHLQGGDDTLDAGDDFDAYYFYDYIVGLSVESPFAATIRSGTIKMANGGTPLPQNRVYFDYGMYSDVQFSGRGSTVNRFVPGIERAFADGLFSVEVRLPFSAADSNSLVPGNNAIIADNEVNFGNITTFAKVLLHRSDSLGISGGLALTLPTASDTELVGLARIDNHAAHLGPFLGCAYAPNNRWFAQAFMQADFATTGNNVQFDTNGAGLVTAGKLNDASYLFSDIGIGYWLAPHGEYQRPTALLAELHHSTNISDNDEVRAGMFQVGDANNSTDVLNMTAGVSTQLTERTTAAAAYVAPLNNIDESVGGGLQVRLEYRP